MPPPRASRKRRQRGERSLDEVPLALGVDERLARVSRRSAQHRADDPLLECIETLPRDRAHRRVALRTGGTADRSHLFQAGGSGAREGPTRR